jgi:heme-degrading monooxygenase HmoA
MIRHKVNDYPAWKKEFDDFAETRKTSGERSFQIFQPENESENLFLLFEWDSVDNARKFFESSILKETMERAGVIEAPEIRFLSEADRGAL